MPSQVRVRARRWQATLIITLVFSAAVGAAAVGWWYARESPPHQGPIVLVAVDGLSSGALGTYGARGGAAPAIDGLAADSVLFERAYIHSPQMLPAYASLLTGRLPFEHGIRDDAGFALKTDIRTLAEQLRSRGFTTGAAVSSFLLRKETGLARGFGFFGGELGDDDGGVPVLERSGAATFETAGQWIRSQNGQRFMLFLEIPAEGSDDVVRDLVALLKTRALYDKATLLIVGGRGAAADGGGLDDAALRVPLLIKQPDQEGAGRHVSAAVQHADLVPTVLDLVRAPIPGGLRGRSLRPVLDHSDETVPARPIYAESLTARYRFGGRPTYALTGDGFRLLRDDRESVLAIGPADLPNPTPGVGDPAPLRAELDRLLDGPAPAPAARLSIEDEDKFARLGMLSIPPGVPAPADGVLPPNQAALLGAHQKAARLAGERKLGDAIKALKDMTRANPLLPALHYQLGALLARAGRVEEAVAAFQETDRLWPDSLPVAIALAHTLARAGKSELAQQRADHAVVLTDGAAPEQRSAALDAAAQVALERSDTAAAERYAQARFDIDGSRALTEFVHGRALLNDGAYEEAREALTQAVQAERESPAPLAGVHLALAEVLIRLEQPADAEAHLKEEIRIAPRDPRAYVNLATLYHGLGRDEDVESTVSALLAALPTPEGSAAAARAWTEVGDRKRADAVKAAARAQFKGDPSLTLLGRARP